MRVAFLTGVWELFKPESRLESDLSWITYSVDWSGALGDAEED